MQKYDFYKELGYTEDQSVVLSTFSYGDNSLESAINAYKDSNDNLKGITFCESLYSFMNFVKDDCKDEELLDMYKFYLSIRSYDKIKTAKELISRYKKETERKMHTPLFFGSSSFSKKANRLFGNESFDSIGEDKGFDSSGDEGFSLSEFSGISCDECHECESSEVSLDSFGSSISSMHAFTKEKEAVKFVNPKFSTIEEKEFKSVFANPTSTFRTTCNTASMTIINSFREITPSMVRIEELMNYFKYNLKDPEDGNMFGINTELAKINGRNIMFIGLQGKKLIPTHQNIVALLDVSGSMGTRDKIECTQASLFTLISKLNDGDNFSLITYSSIDEVIVDNIEFHKSMIDKIIERVLSIDITGCTYGSGALNTAYTLIEKNKIEDGVNRVIILTDGDFNFGSCMIDDVKDLITEHKKTGAYLSVIGVGQDNLNDELMETLAKNGNGNYCVTNRLDDVISEVYEKYNKMVYTIATDVKAQVEFNPKYVRKYRLLGYENREISHDDFTNDKVVSEPFGCGNYCVAVYELELEDGKESNEKKLKYQTSVINDSDEICTVSVRYKELGKEESKEESKEVHCRFNGTDNAKLAYSIGVIGEMIRKSDFFEDKDLMVLLDIHDLLKSTNNKDKENVVNNLMRLV